MDYPKLDDEALLRLITRADEAALGELYDRYSRLVYSMAMNTVGDPALAEEVTQDVYLRIWNKATTYQPGQGKVTTWIASIARYRAIDVLSPVERAPGGQPRQLGGGGGVQHPRPYKCRRRSRERTAETAGTPGNRRTTRRAARRPLAGVLPGLFAQRDRRGPERNRWGR